MKPAKKNEPAYVLAEEDLQQIRAQSYLGKKGYTIPKSALTKEEEVFLKKDLFMQPVSHGVSYGVPEGAFPVYRENANKIYVPRFYGVSRYGLPDTSEIDAGESIDVRFDKPLRDYQEKIVRIYTDYVDTGISVDQTEILRANAIPCANAIPNRTAVRGGGAILEVPCGRGKCLAKDTPVLMMDGTVKAVQDVVVGDRLMGDDSTSRRVLTLARGREMMYRIVANMNRNFRDFEVKRPASEVIGDSEETMGKTDIAEESYTVNKSHILSLKHKSTGEVVDMSVMDYLRYLQKRKDAGGASEYAGYRVPALFPHKETEVDPYVMGSWLFSLNSSFYFPTSLPSPHVEGISVASLRRPETLDFPAPPRTIPPNYKCNSRDVQLRVFAGIIDTLHPPFEDGHYEISIESDELYSDVVFLARSLGFLVHRLPKNRLHIYIHRTDLTYDIRVERLGIDDYYGFEIDGNRRFVLGDFTATHNTIMALKIVSVLQKKTLILVHKEFLMNQWIERIADFLPGTRVGKIQGQTFDVVQKDIVIGMIQTLYDKEFPANAFASFGLTIIDEVHRIGSEQFSKTLLRIITPYMLGISATVERKDGLTKVLNMFIGDKIYTEDRENDDPVCVRAIEYVCADPEFNEVVYDYRGNTQHSTMISKLCAYNRRSDFIVRVIADLVKENPENQIMILGQQRAILTYMFDAIVHRGIATVGYYVGGMKQQHLQETESKQIVLATYAMAAEALDIKTLSTLVMITPKTDIIQSVGRILRVKHDNPIVVDIVDKHDVFQKQWAQRRRFYKKCGYRIRQTDSVKYAGMTLDWEEDRTWRRVFEPKMVASNTDDSSDDDSGKTKPLTTRKCMIDMSIWDDAV